MEDSAAGGTVVPGVGAAGDNDAAADEEGVAAGLASPGVELLHPVITAMGMIARKATNEMRRVAFIIFASTCNDVPQPWTFRASPIRFGVRRLRCRGHGVEAVQQRFGEVQLPRTERRLAPIGRSTRSVQICSPAAAIALSRTRSGHGTGSAPVPDRADAPPAGRLS